MSNAVMCLDVQDDVVSGETFGSRLRQAREAKGLSREDLAQRVSLRMQTLYRYETGKVPAPAVEIVTNLADALGIDFSWLATGEKATTSTTLERDDASLRMVREWLAQNPQVSREHAAELQGLRFGTDDVTPGMVRAQWMELVARDSGRGTERPDLEPPKLRPGRVRLGGPKKKG